MQGPISINVGCVSVVEFMKVPKEAHESAIRGHKGANNGNESVHSDCRGARRGCESIQHSHGLNNTLTAVRKKRMLVDCRGLENAFEAVKVSAEAVRMSIEALGCLRGCERLEEVRENVN